MPIIACVSRLVRHKGFELVAAAIPEIMNMDVQMVVLGTGEWNFEEAFRHAEAQYPSRFSARIQYSAALSTAIYGGADLFLMPSVSEPCGLSQMIAMRYGTVPVVRETGGLKDTVVPHGVFGDNGFTFADINAHDMVWVLGKAVDLYYNDKSAWRGLQHNGMTRDFSWNEPAREYEGVYYQITGIPRPEAEFHAPAGAPAPTEVPIPDEAPVAEEHPAPRPRRSLCRSPRRACEEARGQEGGGQEACHLRRREKASSGAGTAGTKKPAARKRRRRRRTERRTSRSWAPPKACEKTA
ncbi:MAG: glycogen synthase [Intestinimonas sp.]